MQALRAILVTLAVWLSLVLGLVFAIPAPPGTFSDGSDKLCCLSRPVPVVPPVRDVVPCPATPQPPSPPALVGPPPPPPSLTEDPRPMQASCEPMPHVQEPPMRPADREHTGA